MDPIWTLAALAAALIAFFTLRPRAKARTDDIARRAAEAVRRRGDGGSPTADGSSGVSWGGRSDRDAEGGGESDGGGGDGGGGGGGD